MAAYTYSGSPSPYDFDDIEYDDENLLNEQYGNLVQVPRLDGIGLAHYDDIEDFEDDAAFSSPSPPQRIPSQYRNGPQTQYHRSQRANLHERSPYQSDARRLNDSYGLQTHSTQFSSQPYPRAAHQQPEMAAYPSSSQLLYDQHSHSRGDNGLEGPSFRRDAKQQKHTVDNDRRAERGSNPRNEHGIRLRPTSDLPDMYRSLFKFGVFNAVQSTCYDELMHSDNNMVVSSPTGSGKTVLFELAIIRMLMQSEQTSRRSKCIYVAPTKALCSEKYRDWVTKLQPLGINCCELTGDTVLFGKSAWSDAKNATVIVTTGEKWDSLTRNWEEHEGILSQVKLFLADEIHILNETRGSTLEVVISRMKFRGTGTRFVMVSATVPNIQDVARWVGNGNMGEPAIVKEFGEAYRPCKLARHVVAVQRKNNQNEYQFQRTLDYRLYGILQTYSADKPVLIFCSTRRGAFAAAEQLMKEYEEHLKKADRVPWTKPGMIDRHFHDKTLQKLATCGIGIHHAGMTLDDRRITEEFFLQKRFKVILSTSTLAVGVNMPAHMVIIKGVKLYQAEGWKEYSDLDIMQMIGRAGRPQFDKEGIAVIMCEPELESKYRALAQGRTPLESSLHTNLAEHINSEIGLGTIKDVDSAKEWLRSSFLFQRIQHNPHHYAIGKAGNMSWQERVDEMVLESIERLKENQLVESPDEEPLSLRSTEYGDVMSKYYIRQSTMSLILNLPERATLREMLEALASAEEFSEIRLRHGEKQIYNSMRTQDAIRYKMKKVEKASDKVSLLIQAIFSGLNLNSSQWKNGDTQPSLEAVSIFKHASRICRAMVEIASARQSGAQIKHGMELMRCLSAKAWDDRPIVLRQIDQIGEKSINVLVENGITTLDDLRKENPRRIDLLLGRKAGIGNQILASVKQLPQYYLEVTEVSSTPSDGQSPVEVELSIKCGVVCESATDIGKSQKSKQKFRDGTMVLAINSDFEYIEFRKIATKMLRDGKTFTIVAQLTKPSQNIIVQIASDSIAGNSVTRTYKPTLSHSAFPTMDTRPQTLLERELEGLETNEAFWSAMNDAPSDDEEINVVKKDLTRTSSYTARAPQASAEAGSPAVRSSKAGVGEDRAAPQILPNGNYACNHTCKDKTACRHLCCREGLPKPPAWTKRRVENLDAPTESKDKPKQKVPKPKQSTKPDRRLKELEQLHEGNNVQANIQLQRSRIKLDAPRDKKPKPAPNFDLTYTDLKANQPAAVDNLPETADSGDELPDTRDILTAFSQRQKGKTDQSSETHYTDPEFDKHILGVVSPQPSPAKATPATPDACFERVDVDLTMSSPPLGTPPTLHKRRPDEDGSDILPASKRQKRAPPSPEVPPTRATARNNLFLSTSEDQPMDNVTTRVLDDGPFEIDESIFDVQLAESPDWTPSPAISKSAKTIEDSALAYRSRATAAAPSMQEPEPKSEPQAVGSTSIKPAPSNEDAPHPYDVALAEFEAWFNSDAVEIVDRMD